MFFKIRKIVQRNKNKGESKMTQRKQCMCKMIHYFATNLSDAALLRHKFIQVVPELKTRFHERN